MPSKCKVDEFGRDPKLRQRYRERERRRSESEHGTDSDGSVAAWSARSHSSGRKTRTLAESGGVECEGYELVNSVPVGSGHSDASGAERCSPLTQGVKPPDGRSSKESPSRDVSPGASSEGVDAGRRDRSLTPRTVLRRFSSTSGSCCFNAVSFGWRPCALSAEFDVPAMATCRETQSGDITEEHGGERFCLAHTCVVVFMDKLRQLLSEEDMYAFEAEFGFATWCGSDK